MIIIGFAVGFGKVSSATAQNTKDVQEAKTLARAVEVTLRDAETMRSAQMSTLQIQVAETRVTILFMDKKIDELVKNSRP